MNTLIISAFATFWLLFMLEARKVYSLRELPLGLRSVRYLRGRPHHADTHRWSYQQLLWAMGLCYGSANAHMGPSTAFHKKLKRILRKRETGLRGSASNLPEVLVYYQETSFQAWERTALLRFTKHPQHPVRGVMAIRWFAHLVYPGGVSYIVTHQGDVLTVSDLGERAGVLIAVKLWKGAPVAIGSEGILGYALAVTGNQSAVQFCQRILEEGVDDTNGSGLKLGVSS